MSTGTAFTLHAQAGLGYKISRQRARERKILYKPALCRTGKPYWIIRVRRPGPDYSAGAGQRSMSKPPLKRQTTTLWEYPSQNYGKGRQGDINYPGATPSYIIWNLLMRYTRKGHLVVDPMCGSGTTIDICKDTGRRFLGYDIHPARPDVFRADARTLPLEDGKADFVFIDPPYGDNIEYSRERDCIGKIPATDTRYFLEMEKVIGEIHRVLRPGRFMALYVCDYFNVKKGFIPVGFRLFETLRRHFIPVDIIAVVRHNRTLKMGNFHRTADEGNFYLRGFNHLFIMRKERLGNVPGERGAPGENSRH